MAAVSEIYFCKLRTVGLCTQVYVCVCVFIQYLSIPLLSYTQNKYPLFQSWILKSLFCFFLRPPRNIFTDSHCSPSPIKVKNCVSEINTFSSTWFSQPIVIPEGICTATHAHGLHLYCVEQIESLNLYFLSSLNSSKKEMGETTTHAIISWLYSQSGRGNTIPIPPFQILPTMKWVKGFSATQVRQLHQSRV